MGDERTLRDPAAAYCILFAGRPLPGRLPSKDGSERLNPPWSLQPFPDLVFRWSQIQSVRPLLRSQIDKNGDMLLPSAKIEFGGH